MIPFIRKAGHAVLTELGPVLGIPSWKILSTPPKSVSSPYFLRNRCFKFPLFFSLAMIFFIFVIMNVNPEISDIGLSPASPKSSESINCSWTFTGTQQVNVTWYNGSNIFTVIHSATSPAQLSHTYTKRDEVWNCTVRAGNDTWSQEKSVSAVIQNSPPTTPFIQNMDGTSLGSYIVIVEGKGPFLFFLNTTDPDEDVLTYSADLLQGNNYCNIDQAGLITCSPIQEPNLSINDRYEFLARDGYLGGTVGTGPINFNVTPTNDLPFISNPNPIINKTITQGEVMQYKFILSDEEHPNGSFNFSVYSETIDVENRTLSSNTAMVQLGGNRTSVFSDSLVNHTIIFTAFDPINGSMNVTAVFVLNVIPVNNPPVFHSIENVMAYQGESYLLYVNASDMDVNDNLTFSVAGRCDFPNLWTPSLTHINTSNNASAIINVSNLTNHHIACRNITLTVTDKKTPVSLNLSLDLRNVNDPPLIHNYSGYSLNSYENKDIRSLIAYVNLPFVYRLNVTDPDIDLKIDPDDTITYWDNSSLCGGNCPVLSINSSGVVSMLTDMIGNFYYTIRATDYYGLNSTNILNVTVFDNLAPYFIQLPGNKTAIEDVLFHLKINATDPENGSDITFTHNSTLFNVSENGTIKFTPNCSHVGNYSFWIKITDTLGAYNTSILNLEVRMVNHSPTLGFISNSTALTDVYFWRDLSPYADDKDITCGRPETLSFSSSILIGPNPAMFTINSDGTVGFTPAESDVGNYTIRITVSDIYGNNASRNWSLKIYNRTNPPVIHNVTPYGTPLSEITVFAWESTSLLGNITGINSSENTTMVFDHNSTDPDNDILYFNWTINGQVVGNSKNLSHYWDFDSSGINYVTLTVSDIIGDLLAHHIRFTWNVTVENVNRPPELMNNLPNVQNVTQQLMILSYLNGTSGSLRFYDPDNDLLAYNHSTISVAQIYYDRNDIIITPLQVGAETISFTAFDGEFYVWSNNVTINITSIPEQVSGGGSTTTETRTTSGGFVQVPYSVIEEVEKEKEIYLDIIVPQPIVVYRNNTVRQEIILTNKGNATLKGIYVSAETNSSDAEIFFSTYFFPELKPGDSKITEMVITSYRLLNNYEVVIWANVTNPSYRDKAIVYINAIEKTRGNQSVAATKITFAADLLSSNPECMELNEFLRKANDHMERKDYQTASEIIDSVIQGCKHLVTMSKLKEEKPSVIFLGINMKSNPFIMPSLIFLLLASGVIVYATIKLKKENQKLDEG